MSKPDVWMPLLIGKYLADTRHLARDQHGAYLLLLMSAWTRGGSLPDDNVQLARMALATAPEWRKLRPVMAPFFAIGGGEWRQKRLDKELTAAADRTTKATIKAEAAAAARWEKERQKHAPSNAPSNAQASKQECLEDTSLSIPLPLSTKAVQETGPRGARTPRTNGVHNLGTRLPDDWRLPEEWKAWALEIRPDWTPQGVVRESLSFRDYWISASGSKGVKRNWLATWRTWIRRAEKEPTI